jgi:hypothetical protein
MAAKKQAPEFGPVQIQFLRNVNHHGACMRAGDVVEFPGTFEAPERLVSQICPTGEKPAPQHVAKVV